MSKKEEPKNQRMEPSYRISLLVPSRGYCNAAFAMALRNLEMPPFTMLETKYITGCFIDYMRNELVGSAKLDWLMFLDDDVLPPANTVTKLIAHNKDIVAGVYFAKQPPHWPQIFKKNQVDASTYDPVWEWESKELYEADAVGTGCLLVHKNVFNKIPLPWFRYEQDETGHRLLGEDMYFCRKAQAEGFKIWVDPTVVCRHIGQTFIGPEYWKSSREQLDAMKKNMTEKEWQEFMEKCRN